MARTRTYPLLALALISLFFIAACSQDHSSSNPAAPTTTLPGDVSGSAASTFSAVIGYDAKSVGSVNIFTEPYVAYIGTNSVWRVNVVLRDAWAYSSYQVTANLDQIDQATTTVGLNTGEAVVVSSPDGQPKVLKLSLVPGTYRLLIDGSPTQCTLTIKRGQSPAGGADPTDISRPSTVTTGLPPQSTLVPATTTTDLG